jgi:hypothetical protein
VPRPRTARQSSGRSGLESLADFSDGPGFSIVLFETEEQARAEKVVLVLDNLNIHRPGSLDEAFPPAKARRLAEKLEIPHAPKPGSWLNIAEIELSTMAGQCLDRRIPDRETLEREVAAWEAERNALGGTGTWQVRTEDARVRLKRLYPAIDG